MEPTRQICTYSFWIINISLLDYSTLKSTLIQQPPETDIFLVYCSFGSPWVRTRAHTTITTIYQQHHHCIAAIKLDQNHTHTNTKTEQFKWVDRDNNRLSLFKHLCCADNNKYFAELSSRITTSVISYKLF